MAMRKLDVIGILEVGGVSPGGTVELDDDIINVEALLLGGLCAEHVETSSSPDKESDEDFKSFKNKKGD